MKNITLLALGIFTGAVSVIYVFGSMSGNRTPNNFSNLSDIAEATPFSAGINLSSTPIPTKTANPVTTPDSISVPTVSATLSSTPIPALVFTPISTPIPTSISTSTPAPTNITPVLNRNEVAKHSSQGNCYLIINNKVYNISSYFGSHPGGDSIMLGNCGKEASEVFSAIHSNFAWDLLSKYFIGNLVAG